MVDHLGRGLAGRRFSGRYRRLSRGQTHPAERIVTVERGDVARSVVARGKIEPLSKVEVKSKANGIIKALLVDVGEPVTQGQVLAELDKEDLQAQVREAKATLDAEEANLQAAIAAEAKDAHRSGQPRTRIHPPRLRTGAGVVQAEDRVAATARRCRARSRGVPESPAIARCHGGCAVAQAQQARARVAAAKAVLDRAEETLGYATIRAPINGIVLSAADRGGRRGFLDSEHGQRGYLDHDPRRYQQRLYQRQRG